MLESTENIIFWGFIFYILENDTSSIQVVLADAQLLRFSRNCRKVISWDLFVRLVVSRDIWILDLRRGDEWLILDRLNSWHIVTLSGTWLHPCAGLKRFQGDAPFHADISTGCKWHEFILCLMGKVMSGHCFRLSAVPSRFSKHNS